MNLCYNSMTKTTGVRGISLLLLDWWMLIMTMSRISAYILCYRERLAEKEYQTKRNEALSRVPSLVYMYTYTHTHTYICMYRRWIYLATWMYSWEMCLTVCIYLQHRVWCITYHIYVCIYLQYHVWCITYHIYVPYLPSLTSIHCDL